jgi:hypothetical protein
MTSRSLATQEKIVQDMFENFTTNIFDGNIESFKDCMPGLLILNVQSDEFVKKFTDMIHSYFRSSHDTTQSVHNRRNPEYIIKQVLDDLYRRDQVLHKIIVEILLDNLVNETVRPSSVNQWEAEQKYSLEKICDPPRDLLDIIFLIQTYHPDLSWNILTRVLCNELRKTEQVPNRYFLSRYYPKVIEDIFDCKFTDGTIVVRNYETMRTNDEVPKSLVLTFRTMKDLYPDIIFYHPEQLVDNSNQTLSAIGYGIGISAGLYSIFGGDEHWSWGQIGLHAALFGALAGFSLKIGQYFNSAPTSQPVILRWNQTEDWN